MTKKIYEVMNEHVLTINPETAFTEACRMFQNFRYRHLPVVGPDGTLVGMFSINDAMATLNSRILTKKDLDEEAINNAITVSEVMTSHKVHTIEADNCIEKAIAFFQEQRAHSIVVVRKGSICGILTPSDVLRNVEIPSQCIQC